MKKKHKYHAAFMVVDPYGMPLPFLTSQARKLCHSEFEAWHPDLTWKRASRKGWKARKICYHFV